jgi:peptidoglycan/xylan/chitin deacetylase (PgdA/CDA1 family)
MQNIPVITYHKISDIKEFGLTTVTQNNFEEHIQYLSQNGYTAICFSDIVNQKVLPDRPIIITFDDGYENVYHNALPVLNKYGYRAVIFVVTDYIGKYNNWEPASFQSKYRHLSQDQIRKLSDNGYEIASHSERHRYLPILDPADLLDEIANSKNFIEKIIGGPVLSFCYPYGRYNDKIVDVVKRAGYQYATSNLRLLNSVNTTSHTIIRRSIYSTDTIRTFSSKLKLPFEYSGAYFSELLIQKGALASIGLNLFRDKSKF